MRIIFIRHGDPDYVNDTLTEKGIREAQLLAQRVATWDNITDYYVSPLGRARLTAQYSLEKIGREAITYEWLREFQVRVLNPDTKRVSIPWDLYPEYWRNNEILYDKDKWQNFDLYEDSELKTEYERVKKGLSELLKKYGITKEGNLYKIDHENDDTTIVLFCHLGVSFVCLGELLGISPALLWHTFFVPTTSVTVVGAEEVKPGILNFRVQMMGDARHLPENGEPISKAGYFYDIFQK